VDRQAERAADLGSGGGQHVVLGTATGVAAGAQVHDAGRAGKEHRRAGAGELQQDEVGQHGGAVDDQVGGQGGGGRAAAQGERQKATRHAGGGADQAGLEAHGVVAQGIDRTGD